MSKRPHHRHLDFRHQRGNLELDQLPSGQVQQLIARSMAISTTVRGCARQAFGR
jgi:hypothetical protein